jgi:AraC-like DNA-binding protein
MTESVRAWRPEVPLLQEVLHARFERHAYPAHTHDSWTVLLIDSGAVSYDLDRHEHVAAPAAVTLLPPHVPHDGRTAVPGVPFRKRVLYLDPGWLPAPSADAAARHPMLGTPDIVGAVERIHEALAAPGDALTAEGELLGLAHRVRPLLGECEETTSDRPLARSLRRLLDDRFRESFTIAELAEVLGASRSHLVRVFSQTYGIAPHGYVIGRRVDAARRLLLDGRGPAEAASASGFHDQAHLTRHFSRVLGTTPGRFTAA